MTAPQLYRWRWRARLPERFGQLLRVTARGELNSCRIEFVTDGVKVITSRNALEKVPMKTIEEYCAIIGWTLRGAVRAAELQRPHRAALGGRVEPGARVNP